MQHEHVVQLQRGEFVRRDDLVATDRNISKGDLCLEAVELTPQPLGEFCEPLAVGSPDLLGEAKCVDHQHRRVEFRDQRWPRRNTA